MSQLGGKEAFSTRPVSHADASKNGPRLGGEDDGAAADRDHSSDIPARHRPMSTVFARSAANAGLKGGNSRRRSASVRRLQAAAKLTSFAVERVIFKFI